MYEYVFDVYSIAGSLVRWFRVVDGVLLYLWFREVELNDLVLYVSRLTGRLHIRVKSRCFSAWTRNLPGSGLLSLSLVSEASAERIISKDV